MCSRTNQSVDLRERVGAVYASSRRHRIVRSVRWRSQLRAILTAHEEGKNAASVALGRMDGNGQEATLFRGWFSFPKGVGRFVMAASATEKHQRH